MHMCSLIAKGEGIAWGLETGAGLSFRVSRIFRFDGVVMSGSAFPMWLSDLVVTKKIEQRFGVAGLGRLIKLIELFLSRGDAGSKSWSVVIAWGDFMALLQCNQEVALEFLAYCEHARLLDRTDEDGRLRIVLVGDLAARLLPTEIVAPALKGRTLFDTDKQWVEWFKDDLACPPYLVNDPATRYLFRRWCATNVTLDEVEAAIELAKLAREAPTPAVLHDHLKAHRLAKINSA